MTTLFGVGFATSWVLMALALLPVIWWLLRLTPPRPDEVSFPPTRLLFDLPRKKEEPARSPWWLTLLRLLAVAALIIALAQPVWRPEQNTVTQPGPIWLLIDNTWAAAPDWDQRLATLNRLIDGAKELERPVLLLALADSAEQSAGPISPGLASERAATFEPRPWHADRLAFVELLGRLAAETPPARIDWLTDGLEQRDGQDFAVALASLAGEAEVRLYQADSAKLVSIAGARNDAEAIVVDLARPSDGASVEASIAAMDLKGLLIGGATATFNPDDTNLSLDINLPLELRNEVARLEVTGSRTAGAVYLVDDQWQRRRVGIVAGTSMDRAQPLLSSEYYIRRAVSPYATMLEPRAPDLPGQVEQFIEDGASLIFLADVGSIGEQPAGELLQWVNAGGMIVRFAVSGLDQARDGLLPVRLRSGARDLGGTLTWSQPQTIGGFLSSGPFAGLRLPDGDITVTRQVLAQPESGLLKKTWAQLTDGTPLVTGERVGSGWIVLFHVPADTAWSSLPLSGVFVQMLDKLVQMSRAASVTPGAAVGQIGDFAAETLPPLRLLDGYGQFGARYTDAEPLPVSAPASRAADRTAPPGLYGTDNGFRALNVHAAGAAMVSSLNATALDGVGQRLEYTLSRERLLAPPFYLLALILLLADSLIVIAMSGGFRRRHFVTGLAGAMFLGGVAVSPDAVAQDDFTAVHALEQTRLAYVRTGNDEIDHVSERGLYGLSQFLALKTALEPGDPIGVDVSFDELVFFPLLYWPIDPAAPQPPTEAIARVETYMKNGGTVLFDTRDSLERMGEGTGFGDGSTPESDWLREMLRTVDVPPLEPVPLDHVLTKTFYLMSDFPGRFPDGLLWIEALDVVASDGRPVRSSDGVSPILITGNDMAGAWAIDDQRRPLFPTIPNDSFQRELAYRVGVNVVMYTLTGNYKADQVHVPALLERLGQ